jgi:hypothetical protein
MGATPALAKHPRPLPRLAVRDHAAADPGEHGADLLRAVSGALSDVAALALPRWTRCWPVERPGLLQPCAQPAPLCAGRGGRCMAGRFPRKLPRCCKHCRALAALLPRPLRRFVLASAWPSWMATSSAYWRAHWGLTKTCLWLRTSARCGQLPPICCPLLPQTMPYRATPKA